MSPQPRSAGATRSQPPPSAPLVVAHPRTGEVLAELEHAPPALLAEFYAAVVEEQARLKAIAAALKAELQARLAARGVAVMTVGEWEVGERVGRSSRWDGQELEQVVRDLIDAGAITARDVEGLIKHEVKVDGNVANALSRRLVGHYKAAVESCRSREPVRRNFDVVASIPLVPEGEPTTREP